MLSHSHPWSRNIFLFQYSKRKLKAHLSCTYRNHVLTPGTGNSGSGRGRCAKNAGLAWSQFALKHIDAVRERAEGTDAE